MQNESDKLKTVLLGILELVTGDEIQINSHRFTPTEQNNVIALLSLLVGKHLGFTEEELIGALKQPETQPMQEASQLVLRVAVIAFGNKEHQKHGETRNDE